jgi:hypothetical protein
VLRSARACLGLSNRAGASCVLVAVGKAINNDAISHVDLAV